MEKLTTCMFHTLLPVIGKKGFLLENKTFFYLRDAEAAKLRPVKDYLVSVGEHKEGEKFTLSVAKDYLNRFRLENPILCKGLPILSSSTVEASW